MITLPVLLLFGFTFCVIFAIICDLLTYQIPNWISLGLIFLFIIHLALSALVGEPLMPFVWGLSCGFAILVIGFILFALNVLGGGDAKFAAVLALWMGWPIIAQYLFLASILGGVLTLLIYGFRQMPIPAHFLKANFIARLYSKDEGVPYGIALGSAGLVMIYEIPVFQRALINLFG